MIKVVEEEAKAAQAKIAQEKVDAAASSLLKDEEKAKAARAKIAQKKGRRRGCCGAQG